MVAGAVTQPPVPQPPFCGTKRLGNILGAWCCDFLNHPWRTIMYNRYIQIQIRYKEVEEQSVAKKVLESPQSRVNFCCLALFENQNSSSGHRVVREVETKKFAFCGSSKLRPRR
jgi:hypothetical protein